jgi:phosphoglycolate phosphatase
LNSAQEHFELSAVEGNAIRRIIETGLSIEDIFAQLWRINSESLQEVVYFYRAVYASEHYLKEKPFEGVLELLKKLSNHHDIKNVIVSNKGGKAIISALDRFDLRDFFDHVYSATDLGYKKPNPELFLSTTYPEYQERGNIAFLLIGDSTTDIRFAENCKLPLLLCVCGY